MKAALTLIQSYLFASIYQSKEIVILVYGKRP